MTAIDSRSDARRRKFDATPPVELVVGPRYRDLAGFEVNRVWPTARRRLVGPFIFFDHMLPADLPPGRGLDVPPHPHIGLATVTYLFTGELVHRDSLGIEQLIRPGELNWMTAGRGIVHSERSSDAARAAHSPIHGIQAWVALPRSHEADEPSFKHYPSTAIPRLEHGGLELKIIAGAAFGARSPAATLTDLFYVEADFQPGCELDFSPDLGERAAYIVGGALTIDGIEYDAGSLLVFEAAADVRLIATRKTKLMLFGGAPLPGEWHVWWNFVASSTERIERAKQDWQSGRFPSVPGDTGYMPLPR